MKEIKRIDTFMEGNIPSEKLAKKINELIDTINKQQQEIESLKQQVGSVDDRTIQF